MNDDTKMSRSIAKRKRLDPLYALIMAVLAALPFLLVRVFAPGPVTGAKAKAPAPALEMNLPDAGAEWAAETLAGLTLEQKIDLPAFRWRGKR